MSAATSAVAERAPRTVRPPDALAPLIVAAADRHGLEPELVAAVASACSGFDPCACSPIGARGLMGLMPPVARALGVTDPLDPGQSLEAGARHLRRQLDEFGDLRLALAAYGAGADAVRRHGGMPPYSGTRAHVPMVMACLDELRETGALGAARTERGTRSGGITDKEGRC